MNNKCKFLTVLSLVFLFTITQVQAEKYKGPILKSTTPKDAASCHPPAKNTELALNNVRAYLKTNGTMWFKENAEYEVPKGSGKMSMFSAALWIGGVDAYDQLYVAAMRFGQVGNDYWTGPLKMKDGKTNPQTCSYYDNFYRISRIEVERHMIAFEMGDAGYIKEIPKSILEWPANPRHANTGESQFLAPFVKVGGGDPNIYEPTEGDYPYYDFANDLCPWTLKNKEKAKECPWLDKPKAEGGKCDPNGRIPNPDGLDMPPERIWTRQQVKDYGWDNMMIYADHVLKGDETVFWFLNDRGGSHTESGSTNSIGLEIRVQAFAFATNDELNKMTFYSYEIINRGANTLNNTFFSQWVDPDLGFADDDYVGCDVNRGLGYCYNGAPEDGTGQAWAYGANPPAVGVDFFQGPYIDPDGADNPKFYKTKAAIDGNPDQQAYCKRFVDHIFESQEFANPENDPNLYDKFIIKGNDTIRWNDQFAINGVNFGDGIVDNERFGMRRFVYHNNDDTPKGDPKIAIDYYRMLQGIWKDNTPMTYGGDAYKQEGPVCDFMFPAGTDYCNWGTRGIAPNKKFNFGGTKGNWSEEKPDGTETTQANPPADRRFMQSAGPFKLRQGACNYITVGIPWARATQGGSAASVALLMVADDKCQALFENCFKLLDGPDAPVLTIREYDQKLIFLLSNDPKGNNANEDYIEEDGTIPEALPWLDTIDRYYRFEGYQIFQVTGPEIGANDLDNSDLARLVAQYDIVNFDKHGNPVGTLINWEFDEEMQLAVPRAKVLGANKGIKHSLEVTIDLFATGNDKRLVNYKTYYYIAIAYAYNEFWPFSIDVVHAPEGLQGQRLPYLRGRKMGPSYGGGSVVPVPGTPHLPSTHLGGSTLNSDYGSIPNIIRVDGQGNGGVALELTQETIDKIVSGGDNGNYSVRELKYEKNAGPLNIRIVDPLRVKPFDYTLFIRDSILDKRDSLLANPLYKGFDKAEFNETDIISKNAYWVLRIDETVTDKELIDADLVDGKGKPIREFRTQRNIDQYDEQIIFELGISIGIQNVEFINKQPRVLQYWNRIFEEFPTIKEDKYRDYKAKHIYCQPEKIHVDKGDIVFSNNGSPWITGLKDVNANVPSNWIRAGSYNLGPWFDTNTIDVSKNYHQWRLEDACLISGKIVAPIKVGDPRPPTLKSERAFKDFEGKFGTLCGGTWAPYVLASPYNGGPQAKYISPEPQYKDNMPVQPDEKYYEFQALLNYPTTLHPGYNQTMTNLYSVNVVITPNKDLWTRCVVLESCSDPSKSIGGALKNEPRKSKSVDKNGNSDNSKDGFGTNGDEGMGWFPGYAINMETGERLNIMFSENSDTTLNKFKGLLNGNDMIFNPTSTYAVATKDTLYEFSPEIVWRLNAGDIISQAVYEWLFTNFDNFDGTLQRAGIEIVCGGMHYVYVCGSSGNTSSMHFLNRGPDFLEKPRRNFNLDDVTFKLQDATIHGGFIDNNPKYPVFDLGPYDGSEWLVKKFKQFIGKGFGREIKKLKMQLFSNVMYTYIPLQPEDPELKKQWLSSDVTFKIRVTRPYMRYISRWYESPEQRDKDYKVPEKFENQGFPVYKISTRELAPTVHDTRSYSTILDKINIVPNPYYGGSFYEKNALDTKVKITNLPTDLKNGAPITINIFTVNGILVRTLTKGDSQTSYVDWDLKNYANIPIAGGVYIIHVNCPGIGERMLKFFCTMRPTDLNNF